jgi:CyaY protein
MILGLLFEAGLSYVTIANTKPLELFPLNSTEFNEIIDETLIQIEDAIEDLDSEIDYDTVSGILTLEFSDQSKIIINRQIATLQLWVAAKSGGFHFDYKDNDWLDDRDSTSLQQKLSELISEQAGETLQIQITL